MGIGEVPSHATPGACMHVCMYACMYVYIFIFTVTLYNVCRTHLEQPHGAIDVLVDVVEHMQLHHDGRRLGQHLGTQQAQA